MTPGAAIATAEDVKVSMERFDEEIKRAIVGVDTPAESEAPPNCRLPDKLYGIPIVEVSKEEFDALPQKTQAEIDAEDADEEQSEGDALMEFFFKGKS